MALRTLVVGGTSGIGLALAHHVAATSNAVVTVCGRTKPANLSSNIEFSPIEATSMRGIKQWADNFKDRLAGHRIALLILSQGTSNFAGRDETDEGIDRKMALHYYGRQLIVRELTPVLEQDAKVLFILNGREGSPARINWDDLDLRTSYSMSTAAQQCATMLDIMVQHYATIQKGDDKRHYAHVYPGGVLTGLTRAWPWYMRAAVKVVGPLIAVKPETCAQLLLGNLDKVASESGREGYFWSNMDSDGSVIKNKAVWSQSQRDCLAEHTWSTIDSALNSR
ncbi:Dehydrogenase reductase SDR family member on chromosome X [Fusarium tjaetaba]|uniref:Dehydrogenase reductase SDR family member on chromosome X n=1 Tax=Fusarium tjaetaba TaxID=1567544 RepID=A0A8H5WAN6_9HYPO|nr:Dehydrogenase reductase SDR family member on chromosome X [Fusarium tjaetaba]KAF5651363.1 Dehydrogenase reductase SDR family member on chromosome X [Fusarium tjaetaba]